MNNAALYLRSSKDRSDVSIDAQRRQLAELAQARNQIIIKEFSDAVESGKDDDRPGFQAMLREMRNPKRGWNTILVLDTSRIARRRHIAIIIQLILKCFGNFSLGSFGRKLSCIRILISRIQNSYV